MPAVPPLATLPATCHTPRRCWANFKALVWEPGDNKKRQDKVTGAARAGQMGRGVIMVN